MLDRPSIPSGALTRPELVVLAGAVREMMRADGTISEGEAAMAAGLAARLDFNLDEIEDLPVGETEEISVDLDAGHYVLVCNIYDEDEDEAHYQEGMQANFEVTD